MNDWALLPVAKKGHNSVVQYINKPAACAVQINRPLYQVLRQGLSAVASVYDDFEDMADGADLNGRTGWTVVTEGSNTCKAEVTLPLSTMEGVWIKMVDTNDADNCYASIDNATPQAPSATNQYWASCDIEIVSGVVTAYLVSATGGIMVKFSANTLYYYNGSGWIAGCAYAVGTHYTLKLRATSDSTGVVELGKQDGTVTSFTCTLTGGQVFGGVIRYFIIGTYLAASQCEAYFDKPRLSWVTESVAWDEDNTDLAFMKVVNTSDSVTAALLNSDFDAQTKLVMYKVTGVRHGENNCYLDLEEWHAQLWRDKHAEDDNVKETLYVEDITDTTNNDKFNVVTTKGGSTHPAWEANDQVNRGVRIVAATGEAATASQDGSPNTAQKTLGTGGSESVTGTIAGMNAQSWDNGDAATYYNPIISGATSDDCEEVLSLYFNVARFPDTAGLIFTIYAGFALPALASTRKYPTIYLVNQAGGSNLLLHQLTLDSQMNYYHNTFACNIPSDIAMDYYDAVNERFELRIFGGRYSYVSSGTKYASGISIGFAQLAYTKHYQHSPVEYKIQSNTAHDDGTTHAEVTIVDSAGVYDTKTNHINHDDTVQVLYTEEEWLEDHVVLRAKGVGNIYCASTAATTPTYGVKRNKFVRNDISAVCDRNTLYSYLSRKTTTWKPDLYLIDRALPTFHGGRVYPVNLIGKTLMPVYNVNFLEKVRSVTIDNTVLDSTYPTNAPSLSDYPPLVTTRKEVPDAYLAGMAQGLYTGRSAVAGALQQVYLHSVRFIDEDFKNMAVDDDPSLVDTVLWSKTHTTTATLYSKVALDGGINKLRLYDADGTNAIGITKVFSLPRTHAAANRDEISVSWKPVTGLMGNCYSYATLYENTTAWLYLRVNHVTGQLDYSFDGSAWVDSTLDLTLDAATVIHVLLTAVNKFKLALGAAAWDSEVTNDNSYTTNLTKITFATVAGSHGFEGFESYAEHAAITGGYWNAPNANGNGTFTAELMAVGDMRGYVVKAAMGDWTTDPIYTFDTAMAAAGSYKYTLHFDAWPSAGVARVYVQNAGSANNLVVAYVNTSGQLYVYNNITATLVGTLTLNADNVIEFYHADNDGFKVRIGAGSWTATFKNYSDVDGWPATIKLEMAAADAYAYYIDDIVTSWATAGPDVAPVDAYIGDLCDDGSIQLHAIEPEYYHVGCALDFHLAPTTKNGTDYAKNLYRTVIKELEWLDENDAARCVLGFDDASRTSIEEARDRALQRLLDPANW